MNVAFALEVVLLWSWFRNIIIQEAIVAGKRAAVSINRYLTGEVL